MSGRPAEIQAHWDRVVLLGCLISGAHHDVTIHHAHGGSLKGRGFHRSSGRKTSDWLVIPLIRVYHVGPAMPWLNVYPIDGPDRIPVTSWERKYRTQAEMLDEVCERLGVDVWALARGEEKGMVRRAA